MSRAVMVSASEPNSFGDGVSAIPSTDEIEKTSQRSTSSSYVQEKDHNDKRDPASGMNNLSLDHVAPVDVSLRRLCVSVDAAPSWLEPATYGALIAAKFNTDPQVKHLLHSVNADFRPGSLTAVIGGSGSGKTTLLNAMAKRLKSSRLIESGVITFNGQNDIDNVRQAYVMQQDVLLPTLTVRETLQYSSDLRLPSNTSKEYRHRVVEEVLRELGLKECAHTRIGSRQHRGCSGGEKRRVSIGVQLLANPSVLFLDEPTTGLDATTAFQLVRTLKALAQKGRTVITTIHQPRSEIWNLFDNLVVLSRGRTAYSGPITDCLPWFKLQGQPLPPFVNPAEHIIDITAVDNRTPEMEQRTTTRVENLTAAWEAESMRRYPPPQKTIPNALAQDTISRTGQHAGFMQQMRVLTGRTLKVTYRDPLGMAASIIEAILMGVVTGYIFFDLGRDQAGIRSREGGLWSAVALQGYLILIFEVYRMTLDIPTFDRESSDKCVDALPFVLSRRLARLPTEDLPVPFIFSVLLYFMAGYERTAGKFFIFLAISILIQLVAVTCAMTCVVTVRNFAGASLIANLAFTVQSNTGGMFVQIDTIPVYVRWLRWTAFSFYAFGAYAGNEFEGNFYDCPYPGGPSNPACVQYSGDFVMQSLGFPSSWVGRPIAILAAFAVFFIVLSVGGLHFLTVEMTITRSRTADTDLSAGKEKMTASPDSQVRAIDIGLDRFALYLDRWSFIGKKPPRKTILNPVTTRFRAGVLNVIMGPSGSGKTSLLNAMALRLRNSSGTKYRAFGKLTFNDAVPSNSVIRSVCSYVCQDDDALLPSLTVRETLRFAAGLRLPSFMRPEEKCRRAEEVLMKMGLKDCADNLIGSHMVKGISGGEKRRVSIAVQVLTDPRVLLLDEPTSGLDAFTASSILEVLEGLANEGRTVIFTIHQARSDLFQRFGDVLLLARGGIPVFAGPGSQMLGYFRRRGHECPEHTNPADFALDTITIDLRKDDSEAESRERVQKLADHWAAGGVAEVNEACAQQSDEAKSCDGPKAKTLGNKSGQPSMLAATAAYSSTTSRSPAPGQSLHHRARLSTPAELGALVRDRASFFTALPILLRRASINTRRRPELILARTMQVAGLAIVFTLFFAPVGNDYLSVQSRMGFVQQIGAFYFVGMLQNVAVYPDERDVFYREDDDGVYTADTFLASYTMLEVPFEIISCLLFGVLATFAVGLPRTAIMCFTCMFGCFGIVSCGESLGIIFNTLFDHAGFAVNTMGFFLSVANIIAGVLSIDMPGLFEAVNYLSPIRYATRAVAPYSLRDVKFTCEDAQRVDGRCPIETGQQVLDLYSFNADPVVNIGGLAACVVVYRVLAWAVVRAKRGRWRDKKAGSDETTTE